MSYILLDETDSTNNYIKANIPDEGEIIVTARRQTGGKGRLGRSFSSEEGGLYLSAGFYPDARPEECLHYTALTGLAVSRTVERLYSIRPEIKWPNDVLYKGKKICGILLESVFGEKGFFIVAGIGINLKNPIPSELPQVSSLFKLTGIDIAPETVRDALIAELKTVKAQAHSHKAELLAEYERGCINIGKKVDAAYSGKKISGVAVGIDENAALILEKADGERVIIMSGEASLRGNA